MIENFSAVRPIGARQRPMVILPQEIPPVPIAGHLRGYLSKCEEEAHG